MKSFTMLIGFCCKLLLKIVHMRIPKMDFCGHMYTRAFNPEAFSESRDFGTSKTTIPGSRDFSGSFGISYKNINNEIVKEVDIKTIEWTITRLINSKIFRRNIETIAIFLNSIYFLYNNN